MQLTQFYLIITTRPFLYNIRSPPRSVHFTNQHDRQQYVRTWTKTCSADSFRPQALTLFKEKLKIIHIKNSIHQCIIQVNNCWEILCSFPGKRRTGKSRIRHQDCSGSSLSMAEWI
ncbi:hypothetical protein XENOCAPTIV_022750 [Xenoophorus captivus]|uniref:Uncharacterized protein n=1 Tax=Xenoophorus captivus TaxID=1517983 RepID=A0ABV0RMW6_9TELE